MAGLGDLLAGIGGNGPNRPALEAFVANSQATNAYRSAQTDQAFTNARKQSDEAQALEDQRVARANASALATKAGLPPELAEMAGNAVVAAGPNANPEQIIGSFTAALKLHATQSLGDPTQLGSPNQTAAQQALEGKLAPPITVPNQYAVAPGAPAPTVLQTPQGAAQTADVLAQTTLRNAQTAAGGFPHTGSQPLTPEQQAHMQEMVHAGFVAPPSAYAIGRNPSLADAAYGAYQQDPTAVIGLSHAKQGVASSFASGTDHKGLVALNTAVQHAGMMPDVVAALNNTDVPWLNKIFQGANFQMGSSAPVLASQLANYLGRELVTGVVPTGGAEAERLAASNPYSGVNSPEQLLDASHQAMGLIHGRLVSQENSYVGTMSIGQPGSEANYREQFRNAYVNPDTRKATGMTSQQDEGTKPPAYKPSMGIQQTPPVAPPGGAAPGNVLPQSPGPAPTASTAPPPPAGPPQGLDANDPSNIRNWLLGRPR